MDVMDDIPNQRFPRHIAVIMDGNGRWAVQRGLERIRGHQQGARTVRNKAAEHFEERGLETLYLACGMATWTNPRGGATPCAPVLLCPARLAPRGAAQEEFDVSIVGELEVK